MAKYRIKQTFLFSGEYRIGEIREFNPTEVVKYNELIEPIDTPVCFADQKPDKKYKKGGFK